jgi:hypothetical protein
VVIFLGRESSTEPRPGRTHAKQDRTGDRHAPAAHKRDYKNTTAQKATGRRGCWAHGREKKIEDDAQLTRNDATRKTNRRVA